MTAFANIQEQFLGVFFEEGFENIEVLEAGLLQLEEGGVANPEVINTVFRAAHSIKGAAATFGFEDITSFAHGMEALLEEVRGGVRTANPDLVDLLLRSTDCLQSMLNDAQSGNKSDSSKEEVLRKELLAACTCPERSPNKSGEAPESKTRWEISFAPHLNMMHTGNDPVRIFEELQALGDLKVHANLDVLPSFYSLVPEDSFLVWQAELRGSASREQLDDIFGWVIDECDLSIRSIEVTSEEGKSSERDNLEDKPVKPQPRVSNSIRVEIEKIDLLMNMIGELVITQSMLDELDTEVEFDKERMLQIAEGLERLARNTRDLQESVMQIRSMPISIVFNRYPRVVHDLSKRLGKKVQLKLTGESTELDKTVLEKIADPLVHLVRNSLDHGIEDPAARVAAGKEQTGTLELRAYHQGGNIVIEIRDDGAGLDCEKILSKAKMAGLVPENDTPEPEEIYPLIFEPGFSTAESVSDVSGRGVGMDVVRRNVQALGGKIDIASERGQGTTITVGLPLTLAIVEGQLIRLGLHSYIVPLTSIVESVQVDKSCIMHGVGNNSMYRLRESLIPMVSLERFLGVSMEGGVDDGLLMIVEGNRQRVGFLVDELLAQRQVVVKSLEKNYGRVDGLSGATILGNGSVAFILDIANIISLAEKSEGQKKLFTRSEYREALARAA